MPAILGVDYGSKRVGVAIAHSGVRIASPLQVLDNSGSLIDDIRQLAETETATTVVVGLPRNLDGDDTDQTQQVRQFAAELQTVGLEVVLQDEAATSVAVEDSAGRDEQIDARAASLILRDYLEEQPSNR